MIDHDKLEKLKQAVNAAREIVDAIEIDADASLEEELYNVLGDVPLSAKVPSYESLRIAAMVMHKLVRNARKDPSLWREIRADGEHFDSVTGFLNAILLHKMREKS